MPIKNYTTTIKPEQTVGEISSLLIQEGARSITSDYGDAGSLTGVKFTMIVGGIPVGFSLPANVSGVAAALMRDEPWNSRRRDNHTAYDDKVRKRASWVAWRILKDWIEAQMALIESNQAEVGQVFMPYAVNEREQRTMYALWVESNQKQLGSGGR
jgi:hypothetical protein